MWNFLNLSKFDTTLVLKDIEENHLRRTRYACMEHDVSRWWRAYARNVKLYYPYRQYTNLFIFRFVSVAILHLILNAESQENTLCFVALMCYVRDKYLERWYIQVLARSL